MNANGALRIYWLGSKVGTAGNNTVRVRFGTANNLTGTQLVSNVLFATASLSAQFIGVMANRNSASSQIMYPAYSLGTGFAAAYSTASINTASTTYIVVSGTLGNSGDTMASEVFIVEYLPQGGL
jgi:hypothetical protein